MHWTRGCKEIILSIDAHTTDPLFMMRMAATMVRMMELLTIMMHDEDYDSEYED